MFRLFTAKEPKALKYPAVFLINLLIAAQFLPPLLAASPIKNQVPVPHVSLSALPQTGYFDQEIFGPYFLTGDGFTSTLIIQNRRIDLPVTVRPVLLTEGRKEIPLDALTIAPNRSVAVDLNQALNSRHQSEVSSGGMVLRYSFPEKGPIGAVITINNARDKLSLMSPIMGREEFMSNVLEGVFWLPDEQTKAFVAIQNTTDAPRSVLTTLFIGGRPVELDRMKVKPRETSFLQLNNELLAHGGNRDAISVGGIRLAHDGVPGEIIAEGAIVNPLKGFSKRISFLDKSLHFYDGTLRAGFLFLGQPPSELGFPLQVSFRAVAAVRSSAETPLRIRPVVGRVRPTCTADPCPPLRPLGLSQSRAAMV